VPNMSIGAITHTHYIINRGRDKFNLSRSDKPTY
jgi:hypothetical protein